MLDVHGFPALGCDPRHLDLGRATLALDVHMQARHEREGLRSLRAEIGQMRPAAGLHREAMGKNVLNDPREGRRVVVRHDLLRRAPIRRRGPSGGLASHAVQD